jgi:protein-tyrosine phosphatase
MTELSNLRPIGGPLLQKGHARVVWRANTEDVPATAYPSSVATVIDLRRVDEIDALPHPLRGTAGYRSVPLFDPDAGPEAAEDALELEDQYIDWLVRHRAGIVAVFRALADAPGDVLVCCSAGKDRTGVVSALLARLWGADLDAVGADYALSGPALTARFAAEKVVTDDLERTLRMQRCVPEVAVALLEHLEAEYGSVGGYLRWVGVSEGEVERLTGSGR